MMHVSDTVRPVHQVYILKIQMGNKVALSQVSPHLTGICKVIVSCDAAESRHGYSQQHVRALFHRQDVSFPWAT